LPRGVEPLRRSES